MKNNKDIGDVFRDRLEGYKDTPDDFVWNNITSELKPRKKNWTNKIIIILLLIGLLVLTIYIKQRKIALRPINKIEEVNNNVCKTIEKGKKSTSCRSIKEKRKEKNNVNFKKTKKIDKKVTVINKKTIVLKQPSKIKRNYIKLKIKGVKPYNCTSSTSTIDKNTYENQSTKRKISVTANFGVNYFNSLSNLNDIYSNKLGSNTIDHSYSYNYGMYINYRINNTFLIRLGIQKLRLKSNINNINTKNISSQISTILKQPGITISSNNNEINNFISTDNVINITQEVNYLEFPLEMKYKVLNGHYNLSTIVGYSMLYQESNTLYLSSSNKEKLNIGYNNSFNDKAGSINLGISSELKLFKNTYFNLELNYKKYFSLQHKALGTPNSLGIQLGINYKF
ncbi:hypothetical protein [Tenacibaculum sp. nBUS_03]|uniref:hypothetical protein n=1 Tax=Tenacibaculum sp. nBUS_03 TaxID=3395320 RepID=UPI003EC105C6